MQSSRRLPEACWRIWNEPPEEFRIADLPPRLDEPTPLAKVHLGEPRGNVTWKRLQYLFKYLYR
jgi:hypothetical protein